MREASAAPNIDKAFRDSTIDLWLNKRRQPNCERGLATVSLAMMVAHPISPGIPNLRVVISIIISIAISIAISVAISCVVLWAGDQFCLCSASSRDKAAHWRCVDGFNRAARLR